MNRISANGFNVQTRQALDLLNGLNGYQNYNSGYTQSPTQNNYSNYSYNQNYNLGYTQSPPTQNNYNNYSYNQNYNSGYTQSPTPQNNYNNYSYNQNYNSGYTQSPTPQNNYSNYSYNQNYNSGYTQSPPTQNNYSYNQNYTQRPKATGVVLKKGQKQSLSTLSPNLTRLRVGLGWDAIGGYDLDAEVFMLGSNEKVLGDSWFVFYGQTTSPDGAIFHHGDNTDGSAIGDDEIIDIQLDRLNPNVKKLVFVVTINEAKQYGYNFSKVSNAYIRVLDQASNRELIRFNLSEYYANVTSMVVGEVYLYHGEWKFNPVGDGTADDLYGLCYRYGVNVAD